MYMVTWHSSTASVPKRVAGQLKLCAGGAVSPSRPDGGQRSHNAPVIEQLAWLVASSNNVHDAEGTSCGEKNNDDDYSSLAHM